MTLIYGCGTWVHDVGCAHLGKSGGPTQEQLRRHGLRCRSLRDHPASPAGRPGLSRIRSDGIDRVGRRHSSGRGVLARRAFALIALSCWLFLLCPGRAGAASWRVAAAPISGRVKLAAGCSTSRDGNAPQIAVDPTNPLHLAATYAVAGASVVAMSEDGGHTWTRSPITGTLVCDGGGGTYYFRFDPDLQFDPWGRLYVLESVQGVFGSGTDGIDVFSLTVAPGSNALTPATPIVGADPLSGAQRAFVAFDPAAPDTADVLTERINYISGQYKLGGGSLQIARTLNGGASFSTATVYSAPRRTTPLAEGLIRHGQELLAFGELLSAAWHPGAKMPESAIMLRSSDGGQSWSTPEKIFDHTVGADGVSDCCLLRPVSGPDGTIYIPDPNGGKLQLVRSSDDGRTWRRLTIGDFGDVSEPVAAARPDGTVAVAFYRIAQTRAGQVAAVRIAVSENHGRNWKLLGLGKPFLVDRLGPRDDTSPLGPVQAIAATPTGFVAAMTVGGSLVHARRGSNVDLLSIAKVASNRPSNQL